MLTLEDRYIRQRDIIPADRLVQLTITVIGVGAIGRQVAIQLAAIGAPRLQLVDMDTVGVENLAPQGYLEEDVGEPKVTATARICRQINDEVDIIQVPNRFRRSMEVGEVAFCCVDSIVTRRMIWESIGQQVSLFVDARMSAEVIRILAAGDESSHRHYPATLFGAQEAHGGACTAKSTIYTANIAAGLAIAQFTKWLRNLPIDADLCLNVLSSELSVC